MGRFGWLGFSRSLLLQTTKSLGSSSATIDRRHEGLLPFLRAISYQSPVSCGCKGHNASRTYNQFRHTYFSIRSFHATGICCIIDRDYYEILGVPKGASQDDIKKAFHALAKKYHPDANRNSPASKRKFQEIRDAYETLSDAEKRAHYDREFLRKSEESRYPDEDANGFRRAYEDPFSDTFYKIFSEVFEHDRERYADDLQVKLDLTFTEAAKGCTKHVSFRAQVPCDSCYGRGHSVNAKPSICPTCKGVGKVTIFPFTTTCSSCKGRGKIIKDYCLACRGSGVVDGVKNVSVTIPPGVDSGDTIQVQKAGNQGGHSVGPGNLYIKLQVEKDPIFQRDGADVYIDARISFTQAILGGNIEVPTLSGMTQVKIPKGVQPGQLLVLRGRGLPKQIGFLDHGDQYVRFRIHFPSSVNDRQRELLEEFAKEEEIRESAEITYGNWLDQQMCTG
ncbi:uncharacterized protein A4U43_C03F3370 [Asparagus officinalis]|uniref:Chaperone protein dnaJ 1, mitochondrial n=1 Tax=Asparagus officinalis TaxID=4686 RepID=A0A5P1FBF6_ASPOF|nr:chaperone protein dnaJ 1, mitochondrial isoform X2 [Asparagus officinalis]ONK74159.1 uncharacterized protein A4U43_C03F3370 [Asparagus officinalis]